MGLLGDLKMYARFAWGLRGFLRETITLEEARAIVQRRLAQREDNFLRLVEKGIFGYPRSPYLPLLKLARIELDDVQTMVRRKGLEDTLLALREAGVYVTFEEFKGREPIVRDGRVISVQAHDFDNPYLTHYYYGRSGGTTGAGTRIPTDLDHLAAQVPDIVLAYETHGVLEGPKAIWFGVLPDGSGPNNILRQARFGQVPERWFSPVVVADFKPSLENRLATQYIVCMGRLQGVPVPEPEAVGLNEAIVVARWAARAVQTDGACLIRTHVSLAARVCVAAWEAGLNLEGATFMGAGEPPTPAKVRAITRTGACFVPIYVFSEAGHAGIGCLSPTDENDNHFYRDILALIQHPREVPGSGVTVDAFHFTTLLPTAPKLMLNVESDDYGTVEPSSCGCQLERYGFTEHLRHIRSFRKLTGEGVTLLGSDMIRILEDVLPARFGGSSLDYQLLEEEDEDGFTRLSLVVSPKVEIENENEVLPAVLDALRSSSVAADLARSIWSQAQTLRLKRAEPVWTARGKLMPLHLARRSERSTEAPNGQ
jgi:hypothetical protein